MLTFENLTIHFEHREILRNLSLKISEGEKLAVTGESGSGKTTLLNAIMGFIQPDSGQIQVGQSIIHSSTIRSIRKNIAYLPQELSLVFDFAKDLFYYPFTFKHNRCVRPGIQQIEEIFKHFQLEQDILQKSLKDISGGEKQRIAISACLLLNKPLVLLDEPTSALDAANARRLIDYIFAQNHLTVVAATHDKKWIESAHKVFDLTKN